MYSSFFGGGGLLVIFWWEVEVIRKITSRMNTWKVTPQPIILAAHEVTSTSLQAKLRETEVD